MIALYPPTRVKLRRLYHFGAHNVYANSDISPKNRAVCDNMAIYLMTCTIRVNLMVFFSYSFLIWAPLYKNLYTDEHEMMLPIILPFTDPETDTGFTINLINQLISVLMGTFVIPGNNKLICRLGQHWPQFVFRWLTYFGLECNSCNHNYQYGLM